MIKLTDLGGNPVYFNETEIIFVREPTRNKAATNARAEIGFSSGSEFVQESVADVIKKLG